MKYAKIVITGGAGFIGTHLAERLIDHSEVVLVDNLRRDSLRHTPHLRDHKSVTFINGDVLDVEGLKKAFEGADAVLHLAAIAGVSSYYGEPVTTLKVNLLGTVNVLEAAIACGVKRLIDFSTSETFGPDAMWVDENSLHTVWNCSDRRGVYATSKLCGEQFVMRYGEQYGIGCSIVRPFNVYGPRQTGEGAIANFCTAAVTGKPIKVYGDGTPLRAWCYITDFVEAILAMLDREEAVGEAFNIGNPRETLTTLGLARLVADIAPGAEIVYEHVDRAEVRSRVPIIEKARRLLQWEPKVDVVQGVRETLEWHRSLHTL